ncbi:MAG: response regulator transcription factor [Chloroflexi bacterium]|nr:response regulator transcription factor [Chloroflexota bacterium]
MKVLIIDDEADVVEALSLAFNLQWQSWEVLTAHDGETGLAIFVRETPDVVVLDISMPGVDGYEVLRRIRDISDAPVLMLTVKNEEMDKVKALEFGADDYITKPFGTLELMARIRAILRRAEPPSPSGAGSTLVCGDLSINFSSREVIVSGKPVKLTPIEYNLLMHLAKNSGKVMPHSALISKVWGHDSGADLISLKVYVRRLRQKVEKDAGNPGLILTERGIGYRFKSAAAA